MRKIVQNDKKYPERLNQIPNPPKQLYIEGNLSLLSTNSIAIIGSRNCTEYGKKYAMQFAEELTKQGITIISGMAKGIDTYAHLGCLAQKGNTIAILGSGFNYIYPPENKILYQKILANQGTIISEYEPNTNTASYQFIQRNRIVCGLSMATLVIEAGYRSGTSITAKFTKEQGKPVFCIPNSIDAKNSAGIHWLINKGAKIVTKPEDILEYLKLKKQSQKPVKKSISLIEEMNIPKEYQKIYQVITDEPIHINTIAKLTKQTVAELNGKLMLMEIEGWIQRLPNNEYKRGE